MENQLKQQKIELIISVVLIFLIGFYMVQSAERRPQAVLSNDVSMNLEPMILNDQEGYVIKQKLSVFHSDRRIQNVEIRVRGGVLLRRS